MGKGQLDAGSYKRLSYWFVILAVVFFLVGLWKFISYCSFIGTCEKVDAVVVEVYDRFTYEGHGVGNHRVRTIYEIYVTYTYQGQTYNHVTLDGYDVVYEGDELEVYVDRDNPVDARLPGNNLYQACVMMIMMPIWLIVARCLKKQAVY
ncbi:MAG: DUF3592 domain-containing protein [Lachnospiraceae bacterium]|nr:DUF3592 domain-containing protein [Lachnospiraceae bacterium]